MSAVGTQEGAAFAQRHRTAPLGTTVPRAFFSRHAPLVARDLIGMILYRPDVDVAARVVETEAYTEDDPACHAYRRRTARNAPLWGPPGRAYVYRSYGMHWCFNTATGSDGIAQGCLIRAAEPLVGREWMRRNRPVADDLDLLRGPAKLCQALAIDGALSGADVCHEDDAIVATGDDDVVRFVDDGTRMPVVTGPRVGVSRAADLPWRFFVADSPWVSPYRRSPRAPRRAR